MTRKTLNISIALLLVTVAIKAQEIEVKTNINMGLDANVKSLTTEQKDYLLKENKFDYFSGTETYNFDAVGKLETLRTVDHTGNKTGTYNYQTHATGAIQLKKVDYVGNHVKRGRRNFTKEFLYSKTNPDSIFDFERKTEYIAATNTIKVDTLKTLRHVITYSEKGDIENFNQFSGGKPYKSYRYSKNKEEMDFFSDGNIRWTETSTLKNGLKLNEVRRNPEGLFISGKKYRYDEKGNLIKVFLMDEKGKETDMLEHYVYLYKDNYWVLKGFQLYDKAFYNPEKLKIEKRIIILKNNTKLEATDQEIETFAKQNQAIVLKP